MHNLFVLHLTSQDLFLSFVGGPVAEGTRFQQEILHVSVKTEQLVSFLVSSRPAVVVCKLVSNGYTVIVIYTTAGPWLVVKRSL